MTTRLAGAFAAGTLAIGILVGVAGTVVVRDVSGPTMGMDDMGRMHQMMSGMMGNAGMGAAGAMDAAGHAQHHAAESR